ncbi:MAG: RagB/SusD family nutrient uptake outer membrane protein [Dysgonamonadaceae bacterium]|nr:RagB/SusD family nutrient uptake outer membrane protein [Dysgonamonadaceae bacterium]
MKHSILKNSMVAIVCLALLAGCDESWLDPKPLSFYTPENAYVDAKGMYSALTACERNMRHEFFGDGAPIITDLITTDIAVEGTTDKAGPAMNLDVSFLPDANLDNTDRNRIGWYWREGFKGIKYANVVVARIDDATYRDEAERNAVLGAAYFQRAYRYYKLTHMFGDIPYQDWEINYPKLDFYTYDRWSILEKMKEEMEFAYQWVPEKVDRGRTSKAACGVLLMKFCMAIGDFDRAIQIGKEITDKYPLMKRRFTINQSKPNTNLMHDLHSIEAKLDMSNTEGLMYVVSYPEVEGSDRIALMRNGVPYWAAGYIITPDGKTGTTIYVSDDLVGTYMDNNTLYGRGIGRLRPTNYLQYTIWTDKEKNDLRGQFNRDSWRSPEDLYYNHPNLKSSGNEWYGKHLVKPANMAVSDSIRGWFSWPHYKLFVPDPLNRELQGGQTPWYIYRSAEVWLMLAECYYWKNQLSEAAAALNEVRTRAGADALTAADVTIGAIIDERARELYYEENRHVELVRISYTYARTGKPCEVFGGRTYRLDNFSGPGGTGSNIKEEGYNFYYDWVVTKNNFYNKGIVTAYAEYKLSVHHVLWPIPANAITSNTKGVINQNIGYPGAENNIPPLTVPKEGTVLGPK